MDKLTRLDSNEQDEANQVIIEEQTDEFAQGKSSVFTRMGE